jgi:hypothetical protein
MRDEAEVWTSWAALSGLENIPSGRVPRALPWAVVGRPVGAGVSVS